MDNITSIKVKTKYDDPVGIWYECIKCSKQFHIPDFDEDNIETGIFIFCPYCGRKIIKII